MRVFEACSTSFEMGVAVADRPKKATVARRAGTLKNMFV